ncbi:MAG: hypothetical protein J6B30_07495 [Muribaculaceae bacterium]|nr:hypothetical protein [Muribaculaceae bacterium]MBR3831818.1 hypothetical protein [Muribaculaceae bacterium]
MKKFRRFFVMMMVAVIGLATSVEVSAISSSYDAKACKMVANKKSACNQGSEPFYVFIKKFKTNKKFMKSRVKPCKKRNCQSCLPGNMGVFEGVMDGYSDFFHGFKTYKYNKKWIKDSNMDAGGYYEESSATWKNVSKNRVAYKYDAYDNECGWGINFIFKRINGKWYLTHYWAMP